MGIPKKYIAGIVEAKQTGAKPRNQQSFQRKIEKALRSGKKVVTVIVRGKSQSDGSLIIKRPKGSENVIIANPMSGVDITPLPEKEKPRIFKTHHIGKWKRP